MRGSDFVFHYVSFLHYKYHKMNFKFGGLFMDSPYRMRNEKATIIPINDGDKCLQYIATVALNQEQIGVHLEQISKIKPCINEYNWKGKNYPRRKDDWKNFRKII